MWSGVDNQRTLLRSGLSYVYVTRPCNNWIAVSSLLNNVFSLLLFFMISL